MLLFLSVAFFFNLASLELIKSKSVNVALETVLEFDNKNIASDVKIIDNVQKFLSKVRHVLDKTKANRRSNVNQLKFTEFLEQALSIVGNYSDGQLEELVEIVDDEFRKYHYKGCKFHELLLNKDVRRYISNSLDEMKDMPTKNLRVQISGLLQKLQHRNFSLTEFAFLEYLNSLYQTESVDKLYNFLSGLSSYKNRTKRSSTDLLKVVRNGIRSIVFDHYSGLNHNVRKDLKMKVATFFIEYNADDDKVLNTTVLRFSTIFDIDKDILKKPIGRMIAKNLDETTPKMKSDNKVHKKRHYISLYQEKMTTRKMKSKKSKNKTHHKSSHKSRKHSKKHHSNKESVEMRHRASDNYGKTYRILKAGRPLKEIYTENNPIIHVANQSKNDSRKQGIKHSERSRDDDVGPRFRSQDSDMESEKVKTTERKSKDKHYKGISIESFESNQLDGHYRYKKNKDDLKRSEKRKSSNLRRVWTNSIDATTDTGYIIHKINSLEKQIEVMKHQIETVGTVSPKRTWLPTKPKPSTDQIGNKNKTKHPDIPFWSTIAPSLFRSKKTTTTQVPLYVFDSSSSNETDEGDTTTVNLESTRLIYDETPQPTFKIDANETVNKNDTTSTIVPNFRSNDNITLRREVEDVNEKNATKLNLISMDNEKITVKERARQNVNSTAVMKAKNETAAKNTTEKVNNLPIELKMEISSNIDIKKAAVTNDKSLKNDIKPNATTTAANVLKPNNLSVVLVPTNTTSRFLSRRTLIFKSPLDFRNSTDDIALYNYA